MQERALTGMNLTYQTLEPLKDAEKYQLSVGTITLLFPQELSLSFNSTEETCLPQSDGTCLLEVAVRELKQVTFLKIYRKLALLPTTFTYHYLASHQESITISEIFTKFCNVNTRQSVPLTLKNIHLLFSDGSTLDFSSRISVFVLWQLAEAA